MFYFKDMFLNWQLKNTKQLFVAQYIVILNILIWFDVTQLLLYHINLRIIKCSNYLPSILVQVIGDRKRSINKMGWITALYTYIHKISTSIINIFIFYLSRRFGCFWIKLFMNSLPIEIYVQYL